MVVGSNDYINKSCKEENEEQVRYSYFLENGYIVVLSISKEHYFLVYSILDETKALQICDFYPKDQKEKLLNNIIKSIYESYKK